MPAASAPKMVNLRFQGARLSRPPRLWVNRFPYAKIRETNVSPKGHPANSSSSG